MFRPASGLKTAQAAAAATAAVPIPRPAFGWTIVTTHDAATTAVAM